VFDAATASAVKLFQACNVDAAGHPLVVDGEVGMYTWGCLFPAPAPVPEGVPSALMLQALAVAGTQDGQRETPGRPNRGPMVDLYLQRAGLDPSKGGPEGYPWCMAFVYWCFDTAAQSLKVPNPVPRTAGCVDHWDLAAKKGIPEIRAADAYARPSLVKPGLVFVLDFGGGHGHTGFVEKLLPGGVLSTIEGNTNDTGSSNGIGVFRLTRRKLNDPALKGFIDYS